MAKGLKIIVEIDPVAQKLYGSFTMGKSDSPMRTESENMVAFKQLIMSVRTIIVKN